MSTFYRCDICNSIIGQNRISFTLPVPVGHVTRFDENCWNPSKEIDICSNCLVSYRSWYFNKKEYGPQTETKV